MIEQTNIVMIGNVVSYLILNLTLNMIKLISLNVTLYVLSHGLDESVLVSLLSLNSIASSFVSGPYIISRHPSLNTSSSTHRIVWLMDYGT